MPYYAHALQDHQKRKDPSLKVPTLTPYDLHAIQDHQKKRSGIKNKVCKKAAGFQKKIVGLEEPTLTPYYAHAIQNHQEQKRPQPQGTYADALLCTRHTRPPEEEKSPASKYLRRRSTTYTPYTTTRRRKEPSLKVPTLTPYYVHALEDHQKK